jgi:hypothetical protein
MFKYPLFVIFYGSMLTLTLTLPPMKTIGKLKVMSRKSENAMFEWLAMKLSLMMQVRIY